MKIKGKVEILCEVCTIGKFAQSRNRELDQRAKVDIVHTDLSKPINLTAKDGFKYTFRIQFTYDSGAIFVYFLKSKSDTVKATEKFIADVKLGKITCIRSDNCSEYTSGQFQALPDMRPQLLNHPSEWDS